MSGSWLKFCFGISIDECFSVDCLISRIILGISLIILVYSIGLVCIFFWKFNLTFEFYSIEGDLLFSTNCYIGILLVIAGDLIDCSDYLGKEIILALLLLVLEIIGLTSYTFSLIGDETVGFGGCYLKPT